MEAGEGMFYLPFACLCLSKQASLSRFRRPLGEMKLPFPLSLIGAKASEAVVRSKMLKAFLLNTSNRNMLYYYLLLSTGNDQKKNLPPGMMMGSASFR